MASVAATKMSTLVTSTVNAQASINWKYGGKDSLASAERRVGGFEH
jgi:hypothetical protein